MDHRHPPSSGTSELLKLLQGRKLEQARAHCERLLQVQNQDATLWSLCSVVHGMLGDPKESERCAREAIRLRPDYPEAHNNLGLSLRLQGRAGEALLPLREALRLRPDYADAYYNVGVALVMDQRPQEAIAHFEQSLRLRPTDEAALNDLGSALSKIGRHKGAADCFLKAITLQPSSFAAHLNLANAYVDMGQFEQAVASANTALRLDANNSGALVTLGVALERCRRPTEAVTVYRRALAHRPDDPEAHFNLGNALRALGRFAEAIRAFQHAIAINPLHAEAHFNLSLVLLAQGHFKDGWREYHWLWKRSGAPIRPPNLTRWNGSPLHGDKVFLYAGQGIGDELFFLRFAPLLKQRGAGRIAYRPSSKISPLLGRASVIDELLDSDAKPSEDELAFSIIDLPLLLKMETAREIPESISLAPHTRLIDAARQRLTSLGKPPYIGVTWRAGTAGKELLLYKESPLTAVAQALRDIPATVLVLQRHPQPGEIEAFGEALGRPVHDLSSLNEDLERMLALLSLMDEYVGVSNTNMHLRAAVGRTAKVLVPAPPEWRWMAQGKESPWFPGFGVYRQGYDGSWEEAFDMLGADLQPADGR